VDQDVGYFKEVAARCRELRGVAVNPRVRDELEKLAAEFDAMASATAVCRGEPRPRRHDRC
jgi:hypothetical protein